MSTIAAWCPHKLSFALGTYIAFGRLGGVTCNLLLPHLYHITGKTSVGFFMGFALTLVVFLCASLTVATERWGISHGMLSQGGERSGNSVSIMKAIRLMPGIFWGMCALCGLFYSAKNAFNYVASALVQTRFGFSRQAAGLLIVLFAMPPTG